MARWRLLPRTVVEAATVEGGRIVGEVWSVDDREDTLIYYIRNVRNWGMTPQQAFVPSTHIVRVLQEVTCH